MTSDEPNPPVTRHSSLVTGQITGLVLAGGMGRRMDSRDKGLVEFRGKPMVAHVIERFAPQVDLLIINANRSLVEYGAFGYPVISDELGGFAGPLAGLHAGLKACSTPFIVTAPCDCPFLPSELVARLFEALQQDIAELAVAKTGDQAQPVFALYSATLLASLTQFLESGGRKIDAWYSTHRVVEVPFADQSAFANINTVAELHALQ